MILTVSMGDVYASCDTEGQGITPEYASDLLNRCADAALRLYAGLPEDAEQQ